MVELNDPAPVDKFDEILNSIKQGQQEGQAQTETAPATTEAPVAETPAAAETTTTPEVTTPAATPPATPPKTGDVSLPQKDWFDEEGDVDPNAQVQTTSTPPAQTTQEEDEIPGDMKILQSYLEQGKTLADLVSDYQITDVSKMTDQQVLQMGFAQIDGLTPEEIETAFEEYNSKGPLDQKRLLKEYRAAFERNNTEKLKQLTAGDPERERYNQAINDRYLHDLERVQTEFVGKNKYGVEVTAEMAATVRDIVENKFTITKADGTIDVDYLSDLIFTHQYVKDIVRTNVTKARNEGRREILNDVSNPSTEEPAGNRGVSGPPDVEAGLDAYLKR